MMKTTRRKFLSLLGGGAAAAAGPSALPGCTNDSGGILAPKRAAPNILMLVVDQERRWDLTFPLVLWSAKPA